MADVTVLTAMYGGCDVIRPQAAQDIDVDWICVTDDPDLHAPEPWQTILEPGHYEHPCMSAKRYKLAPNTVTDHEHVIWVDASMEVTAPEFARQALDHIHDGIATWRHPRRDCIYAEAQASLGAEAQDGKYDALPIAEQVAHYRAEGHPEHGGLYACGTLAWDTTNPRAQELGEEWLDECECWGYQDQISFPVVCRRLGITPGVFPHPQIVGRADGALENPWLRIHPHL
jgi:hypothetical protein